MRYPAGCCRFTQGYLGLGTASFVTVRDVQLGFANHDTPVEMEVVAPDGFAGFAD